MCNICNLRLKEQSQTQVILTSTSEGTIFMIPPPRSCEAPKSEQAP